MKSFNLEFAVLKNRIKDFFSKKDLINIKEELLPLDNLTEKTSPSFQLRFIQTAQKTIYYRLLNK